MKRTLICIVLAVSLLLCGWVVGRAQTPAPHFTVTIDAPVGTTTLECTKGCVLQGGRDLGIRDPLKDKVRTYTYWCGNAAGGRCRGTANGWLRP